LLRLLVFFIGGFIRGSVLPLFTVLLGPLLSAADAVPADAEIMRLLVGKWKGTDSVTGTTGTIDYAKDGTFKGEGTVPLSGGKSVEFQVEGTWQVKDGAIHFKIKKSTRPGVAPVDAEITETVLGIDDKTIRYKRGLGSEKTRERVK
jgi:hypothetical protein